MDDIVDQIMSVMDAAFDPAWGEAWTRRQVSDALTMPSTFAILIDAQGRFDVGQSDTSAGFCLSRAAPGEEELLLIAVKPANRGAGFGRKLIQELVANARIRDVDKIFLQMRANNSAEHLYLGCGFEPIGKRPKYYRLANGERMDAITFKLSI